MVWETAIRRQKSGSIRIHCGQRSSRHSPSLREGEVASQMDLPTRNPDGPKSAIARLGLYACLLVMLTAVGARAQGDLPSLIRPGDISIWDEQYLRGEPKGWTVPGDYHEIFGRGVVRNALRVGRFGVYSGRHLYTTWRPIKPLSEQIYAEGKTAVFDTHVSELGTPAFEIKLDYITFLLSGGNMPNEACVNLLIDGKVVRTATGRNNDMLENVAFDVKAFKGQQAQIQVLDTSTASFGYITIDCVRLSPNTRDAVRVIAGLPSKPKTKGRAETISGRFAGIPVVSDGKLLLGGKVMNLKEVLRLRTGVESAGDISGKRLELINGDTLRADVLRLEEKNLVIRHAMFGEVEVSLDHIAQALFIPGPSIKADPGVLIHSNGNKIPGTLLWIREDNIAIKCALGTIPLPRARVRAFVFNRATPNATAVDTVVLADGSKLSGELSLDKDSIVLTHDALGPLKLPVSDIVRIRRAISDVIQLTSLQETIRQRVGPIPPPAPVLVRGEAGETLRMFPRTVVSYKLPQGEQNMRFRATLAPVANSRIPMTVHIRVGGKTSTYTIAPGTTGVDVDIELGRASEIEITTDSPETISYPCGIEWRAGFIVKDSTR